MSHHLKKEDIHCLEEKLCLLIQLGEKIMTAISDFVLAQNKFNDEMDLSITALQDDIKNLNDTIVKLQTSSGQVTPEDQKSLDDLQQKGQVMADKLTALDALTPPVPPVV